MPVTQAPLFLMITGHRPQSLGGFSPTNPLIWQIQQHLIVTIEAIKAYGYDVIGLTGMAQGVDQAFARACLITKTPFRAYLPFPQQDSLWPPAAQQTYRDLLAQAGEQILVCANPKTESEVRAALMHRNSRMVQDARAAIAVWNGGPGGTADAVRKLRAAQRPLLILHPHHAYHPGEVNRWIGNWAHHPSVPLAHHEG